MFLCVISQNEEECTDNAGQQIEGLKAIQPIKISKRYFWAGTFWKNA